VIRGSWGGKKSSHGKKIRAKNTSPSRGGWGIFTSHMRVYGWKGKTEEEPLIKLDGKRNKTTPQQDQVRTKKRGAPVLGVQEWGWD